MTWVLGNACVLTPSLYRRLKRLAQTVVALGLLSPKSGKMEQKSLGYRKLVRCLQNSAVYRVVCASVKAVPTAARGAQCDTGMDVGPHPVHRVPGVAFLLNPCRGLSIRISLFALLFVLRK